MPRNPRGVFAPWNLARGDMFGPTVQRLIDSHRSGEEPLSSGHDYRQALELAIALKLSAAEGGEQRKKRRDSWAAQGLSAERTPMDVELSC